MGHSCTIIVKGVNRAMAHIKFPSHHSPADKSQELDRWITAIAANDLDALAELYHATQSSVYAFCVSILKNAHDAEDMLQECYLSIHASAGSYQSTGKPMAWIMTIARNLCLMRLRQASRTEELSLEDWKDYLETNEELSTIDRIVLTECMSRLSDQERQIVVLHVVSGFKHREIASMLELNLSTVLSKYHRAIHKLKTFIEKENGS